MTISRRCPSAGVPTSAGAYDTSTRVCRLYDTQFAAVDGGSLGVVSNPLIHGFEVFWDLEPDQKAAREASPSA
jgi:nitrite reductase/ring-hydroxylating ferredoxin subunit